MTDSRLPSPCGPSGLWGLGIFWALFRRLTLEQGRTSLRPRNTSSSLHRVRRNARPDDRPRVRGGWHADSAMNRSSRSCRRSGTSAGAPNGRRSSSTLRSRRSGLAARGRPPDRDENSRQPRLHDNPVHLEHLGVLLVHVDPVRARDVPHVLRVRVAAVVLRRVLLER
jgi:hypothetical protein